MEVFSLLKYWKGGGGGGGCSGGATPAGCSTSSTALFSTAAVEHSDDDGPFFDLDFTGEQPKKTTSFSLERQNEIIQEEEEEDEVGEENDVFRGAEEEEMKSPPFRNADSPIRTATKLRVLMLRLKRSKSESTATTTSQTLNQNLSQNNNENKKKLFTVKFKAEVPTISLLSRASSKSKVNTEHIQHAHDSSDAKRKMKDQAVQKYLKMVKRVSKRHHAAEEAAAVTTAIQRLNLKKRSKSAVAHSDTVVANTNTASKRRDDSLLQHEDGIQSAILHCKRSFNASSDGE